MIGEDMRRIKTSKTSEELLTGITEGVTIEFNRDMNLLPGDNVLLISETEEAFDSRADDVDENTVWFVVFGKVPQG
jgi:hypothetical protein